MSDVKIARRYAKALEELCAEAKNHAVIAKQLETFARTYGSSEQLQSVLASPVVPLEDKRQILVKLFSKFLFAPTTRNFLLMLLDRGRIEEVEAVSKAFNERLDALSNRVRAEVVSAAPLDRADLNRIQVALQRLTGATVVLEAKVDQSLIGGVVTRIGTLVLDGSVRTRLESLRETVLS